MDKQEKGLILIGFAASYLFFGLDMVIDLWSIDVKHGLGIVAIIIAIIFALFALVQQPKKEK